MTIYHHVPNKEAIIDGMVDLSSPRSTTPNRTLDWKTAIAHRALSARRCWPDTVGGDPHGVATSPGPDTFGHHDAVLGCFRARRFSSK